MRPLVPIGEFRIASVDPGPYTLEARFLGYRPVEQSIDVTAVETTRVRLTLTPRPVELDSIEVTALRPDLQPASELEEAAVREANPRDSGELLRSLSGIDAVRRGPVGLDPVVRGPVGLDPVVRGLRETEVGVLESGASITGRPGKMAYRLSGAWREGNDYDTGSGVAIPADSRSREVRGKVGYTMAPGSVLTVSAGYQNQGNIDYPGRLLNANFFDAHMLSARRTLEREHGLLRSAEVLGSVNAVDHGMDNDEKPTAQPMEGRMPPFALDVRINSSMDVVGGRAAVELALRGLDRIEVGADLYSALRDADRTIRRRDNGTPLFEDIAWPAARITDAGLFTRAEEGFGDEWRAAGTVRLDFVRADAGPVSDFFREERGGRPDGD